MLHNKYEDTKRELFFNDVRVTFTKSSVHVRNDKALKKQMGLRLRKAVALSRQIKQSYEETYEKPLDISTDSLAVELLGHFFIQECFLPLRAVLLKLHRKGLITKFTNWMLLHMYIIDCGEKHCDNNRFLWDIIAKPIELFRRKK